MSIIKSFEYQQTGRFSELATDYLQGKQELKRYLPSFPYSLDSLSESARVRAKSYSTEKRKKILEAVSVQYEHCGIDHSHALAKLADESTVTVCTGHQVCLMGGPLYFVFKIAGAIKLAKALEEESGLKVVPVFWMATEDHDFDEIASVNLFGSKLTWSSKQSGAVGRMTLDEPFEEFRNEVHSLLGSSDRGKFLSELLDKSYRKGETLSMATRRLVHELFGLDSGLVVLDADEKSLKEDFLPIVKRELTESLVVESSKDQIDALTNDYHKQVSARECNLFLLNGQSRNRIDRLNDDQGFLINGINKEYTSEELFELFTQYPEKASPNVLLRPLYQEAILPNIAYIGGAAELAYWMELSDTFKEAKVSFPAVLLRNSAQLLPKSIIKKWDGLGLDWTEFFKPLHELEEHVLALHSDLTFSLEEQKAGIENLFEQIAIKASEIDASMKSKVLADGARTLKQIQGVEGRMKATLKKKEEVKLNQIAKIHGKAFPNRSLQERTENIFEYLLQSEDIVERLIENFDPLNPKFMLIGI